MTVQNKPEPDAALRAYLEREGISRAEILQRALAALDAQKVIFAAQKVALKNV